MMSHLVPRSLRRAVRLQRRAPAAAALIVLTLAAAIGADVTVFSIVDPLLLRPLPFERPDELVVVTSAFPRMQLSSMGLSGPEALELPRIARAFGAVGAIAFASATVRTGEGTVRVVAAAASAGAIRVLGPAPAAGRLYRETEDVPGAPPVAVLGHAFWIRAFGGDPRIAGRTIDINGRPTTILGVMPPRADLLNRQVELWLPPALTPATAGSRSDHRYTVIARLAPKVTLEAARADLAAATAQWQAITGEFHSPAPTFHPLELRAMNDVVRGPTARPLRALSAAVVLVLLIACANVANLMLARAEARRTEIAVEIALGAGTRHLARMYLAEALLFSTAASACGLALAAFAIQALKSFGPALVRPDDITINGRVLLFTAAAGVLTSLFVALVPLARLDLDRAQRWLQSGGRGSIGAAGRARLQQALIAAQLAIALALSACGVVAVRSLLALTRVDVGFATDQVMRVQVSLPDAAYAEDARVWDFYDRLLARAQALPQLRAAAVMSGLPPLRPANHTTFMLDGADAFDHNNVPQVDFIQHISAGYFAATGIPLRAGRTFIDADNETGAPVAIVNETLARRFWPGQSAIGHRLRPAIPGVPWLTVVGVAGDVRQAGLHAPAGSEVYIPFRQGRLAFPAYLPRAMNVVAAGSGDPRRLVPALQQIVRALDPAAAVSGAGTMSDAVSRTIAQPRLLSSLLSAFAAIAVMLAAVGVYGVTSGSVAARTAEFGVRVALGAMPRDVLMQVLRGGGTALAAGLAVGSAGAIAGARYLSTLLYSADPWSLPSVAGAGAGLALVALIAAAVPAMRAARLDPLAALRAN